MSNNWMYKIHIHSVCGPGIGMRLMDLLIIASAIIIMLIGFASECATADEAIQLANNFGVGARAMGMGGAAIAVSEDFSALYWNPAGLAQVRRIEISGGLSHQKYTSETIFFGNAESDHETNTRLNAIGMAFPVPTYRGSLVFALGAGRVEDFDALFVERGYSTQDNWWEEGREIQSGGLFSFSLGGAMDVSPTLSLGAAIDLRDGDYDYDWNTFYADTRDIWDEYPNDYDTTYIHDTKTADFDALSIRMGGLLRLSRFVKAGLTIASPVTYDVSGDVVMKTRNVFDNGELEQDTEALFFQNEISTPWEFGFGMAWSVPTFLLAADLRYADWSQMKFNNEPLEDYDESLSVSIGGEYILPRMGTKIRAGYSVQPMAYTGSNILNDKKSYSLGGGFLVGQVMTLDLAWVREDWKTDQGSLTDESQVDRIFMSMGYRF
jgi:hypothetical protein